MNTKRWTKLVCLTVFIALLIGCSDASTSSNVTNTKDETNKETEAQSGGEITIAYSAQPPILDPHMTTAVATGDMTRSVFETLITVDSEYNFQPMLAETYEVNNEGTEIVFNLRKGVLFHNGKEMTSEDVVASMERWKEKSSRGKEQFSEATFEAIDEYTVQLTMPEPLSTKFSVLSWMVGAFAAIMPTEVIEDADETGINEYFGTGPYKFEEWRQDEYIRLSRFEDYQSRSEVSDGLAGKREAFIDTVYFRFVSDPSTRVAGILSGEFDIIHSVPFDNAAQLESNPDVENHVVPGGTQVVLFNKKEGIFTDVRAREAVRAALNMDDALLSAFVDEKYYTLNHNMVMPSLTGLFDSENGKDVYNENDPEKAKQLFEELGYNGEEIKLITTRDYEDQYNASVVVQEKLEQLGLNATLEVYDWPTLLEKKEDPTAYDINIMGYGPQPEPTSYLFFTPGHNSAWTDDPEFLELVKEFRAQPSLEETKDAYDDIMTWIAENVPFVKTGDYSRVVSVRSNIENFQYQDGFILWNMSVKE